MHYAEAGVSSIEKALCPFNKKLAKGVFSRETIQENPIENYEELFRQQSNLYGKCLALSQTGENSFALKFQNATLPFESYLDDSGNLVRSILEIQFTPMILLKKSKKQLKSNGLVFPFILLEIRRKFSVKQAAAPLSIGKSSAIFLIAALQEKIRTNKISENDFVLTNKKTKFSRFGILSAWPEGSSLTLSTLKNLVLVEGDGTAADLLLDFLGRNVVESLSKNLPPFLSQLELAQLMANKNLSAKTPREKILGYLPELKEPCRCSRGTF